MAGGVIKGSDGEEGAAKSLGATVMSNLFTGAILVCNFALMAVSSEGMDMADKRTFVT